jgi:hypothetical protein
VTVGVISRPQANIADFYREMGELFGVELRPHNRYSGAKILRQRWQAHDRPSELSRNNEARSSWVAVQTWKHGMADIELIEPGLRLHFVAAGNGTRRSCGRMVFHKLEWEWHQVIPPLLEAGFRVIAPDYRGAGHSGYRKNPLIGW